MTPPILRLVFSSLKSWWFWLLFVSFLVFGYSLKRMPESVATPVWAAYCDYGREKINKELCKSLNIASTQPCPVQNEDSVLKPPAIGSEQLASDSVCFFLHMVDSFFRPRSTPFDWSWPTSSEAGVVIPSSFVLALIVWLFLPQPAPRRVIADQYTIARSSWSPPASSAGIAKSVDPSLMEDMLRARSLRVAMLYALLSGIATTFVPPSFSSESRDRPLQSAGHIATIIVAAGIAAGSMIIGFTQTGHSALRLGWSIGVRGVFIGGAIALCISLPYQVMRPPNPDKLSETMVSFILGLRLMVAPLVSGLVAAATARFVRLIN